MINKDLYIGLLEEKVSDQDLSIEAWSLTSKIRREEFKQKQIVANDNFFNLGDACREQLNELAREQLANLESDKVFDEMVESFKCASDQKIAELTDIIFELGDECQVHEKNIATFDDLRDDLASKILELQSEIHKLEEFDKSKDAEIKKIEILEDVIAELKCRNHELSAEIKVLKASPMPIIQSTTAHIDTPFIFFSNEPTEPPKEIDMYTDITNILKEKKYRISACGNGIIGKKQGCTAIEAYKTTPQSALQFICNGEQTRDLAIALERSMSKSYKKEA